MLAPLDGDVDWLEVLAAEPRSRARLSEAQLDAVLRAIADFIDLKSPFLTGHSSAVGHLAGEAAQRCRLPDAEVIAIRRTGWLQDLGRVGVSAGIWGKTGMLREAQWERVRLHAYYSERALARREALAELAGLAALHHERLDGSGYHRSAQAGSLPPAARILAAADVYQALIEPRPHRPARTPEAAADELRREVRGGRLDGEMADAVLAAAGQRAHIRRRSWPAGLSEREVEVVRLLSHGLSNRQLAERQVISKETVNNHVRHIYDKIGVSTRAAATLFAMQHDLVGDRDVFET